MESSPVPLGAVIGRRIRAMRDDSGLSQDQAARMVRSVGLAWSRSQLAKVERGDRSIGVEDLVLLTIAFESSVSELIDTDEPIALPNGGVVSVDGLLAVLAGDQLPEGALASEPIEPTPMGDDEIEFHQIIWGGQLTFEIVTKAHDAARQDAERKAARRLDVDPVAVAVASLKKWGTSLTERRDDVVAARTAGTTPDRRTLQALRGRVTRELMSDLEPVLKRARQRQLDDLITMRDALAPKGENR